MVPTVAVGVAFGNGGRQSFAEEHALVGLIVCLAVAGLVLAPSGGPAGAPYCRPRLVVAAYLLPTQVGTTATRLPELFGAPVIIAVSAVPLAVVIAEHGGHGLALTAGVHQQRCKNEAIPHSVRSSMRLCSTSSLLVALPVPLKSSQPNDAARLPS